MLRIRNVSKCRGASFSILCSDWAVNYAETKFCLVFRLSIDIFFYLKLVKIFCLLLRNRLCSWMLCTIGLFGSKLGHKFPVLFKIWLLCEGMAETPSWMHLHGHFVSQTLSVLNQALEFKLTNNCESWLYMVVAFYFSPCFKDKISVLSGWHTTSWVGCCPLAFPGFSFVCVYEMMGDVTSGFSPNGSWIACGLKSQSNNFSLVFYVV